MPPPLSSLKILDFSTLIPGPFATMLLADLGAEVIHVEAPNRPDLVRQLPPFAHGVSAWHGLLNRSKRSLALDLKQPDAVAIIKRLVSEYDIVLEQFRPGVMARLGVGYDALRAANPRLIYCAISAFGQSGPYRERAGHDINLLALSGLMAHTGRRADAPGGGPLPLGVQVADVGASFSAIMGILAAVIYRLQTGEGQLVDVSMLETALTWNALAASQLLAGGAEPQREAMQLNGGSYYDFYCTSDGGYLAVGSLEPKFWQGFCAAIGHEELIPLGFQRDSESQRVLKRTIQAAMDQRSLAEWTAIFAQADLCVEPVLTTTEALAHPQTQARNVVVYVPVNEANAAGATQAQIGSPIKFSASQPVYRHIGVELGAHTGKILLAAGYTPAEIKAWRASGLFG